jgi:hypothetical protein
MDNDAFASKIQKMNYNAIMKEARSTGRRFHPNSIVATSESMKSKQPTPTLPVY